MSERRDTTEGLSLGKEVEYVDQYSPDLLYPIARATSWFNLGLEPEALPFCGVDIWNAYELSWLNEKGKPKVACAEFRFPCETVSIIESKSFKLYLNSLNQTRFESVASLEALLRKDLSLAVGGAVEVKVEELGDRAFQMNQFIEGKCLDQMDVTVERYEVEPSLLTANPEDDVIQECLYSHLLRSLCPVTGQPDWGTVIIDYQGAPINHQGLLTYLIGYRRHQEFHEQCVERIFTDIQSRCEPVRLSVYARYLRRGGLDINPFRSSQLEMPANLRLIRQ